MIISFLVVKKYNMERKFLILPGCDDRNRGDQALIWETVSLAKKAGYIGQYRMLSDEKGCIQSRERGIDNVSYILQHPSKKFKKSDNTKYTFSLKIKWGIASIIDLITKEPLLYKGLSKIITQLYSDDIKNSLQEFENTEVCFVKGGG